MKCGDSTKEQEINKLYFNYKHAMSGLFLNCEAKYVFIKNLICDRCNKEPIKLKILHQLLFVQSSNILRSPAKQKLEAHFVCVNAKGLLSHCEKTHLNHFSSPLSCTFMEFLLKLYSLIKLNYCLVLTRLFGRFTY